MAAIYVELNGFTINPDRWFFDPFAYRRHGGHSDWDWLAEWESEEFTPVTLTGMEDLQVVYASQAFREPAFQQAEELAPLCVVLSFQRLIREAVATIDGLVVPVLATAHDWDFADVKGGSGGEARCGSEGPLMVLYAGDLGCKSLAVSVLLLVVSLRSGGAWASH